MSKLSGAQIPERFRDKAYGEYLEQDIDSLIIQFAKRGQIQYAAGLWQEAIEQTLHTIPFLDPPRDPKRPWKRYVNAIYSRIDDDRFTAEQETHQGPGHWGWRVLCWKLRRRGKETQRRAYASIVRAWAFFP